jgi:hypothetical protein
MRTRKVLFLATALGAALIVTIVLHASLAFGPADGNALAAREKHAPKTIPAATAPVSASGNARDSKTLETEPWGPFRTVDW